LVGSDPKFETLTPSDEPVIDFFGQRAFPISVPHPAKASPRVVAQAHPIAQGFRYLGNRGFVGAGPEQQFRLPLIRRRIIEDVVDLRSDPHLGTPY